MPLGVPWSKRMRISQGRCANGNRRRVEAAGGEFEHGLNLLPRHMKLFDDLLDARTRLKIFENRRHRHPGIPKHPRAAASVRYAFYGRGFGPIEAPQFVELLFQGTPDGSAKTSADAIFKTADYPADRGPIRRSFTGQSIPIFLRQAPG